MKVAREAQLALLGLIVVLAASLALSAVARAATDPLDPTFGEGGVVITDAANGVVLSLAEDRNRRVVAAGTSGNGFVLARYLGNGALDRSFSGGGHPTPGVVRTNVGGGAFGVAVQRDGKIVAAGSNGVPRESTRFVVTRYRPDGSLDRTFGVDGRVATRLGRLAGAGLSMALQRNGRILVGGFAGPLSYLHLHRKPSGLLIRYMPDGSIDRSFARNGRLQIGASRGRSVAITDIEVLPDGRILAAGNLGGRLLLERLLPDGSPDPGFGGGDGRVTTRIGRNNDCEGCPITSAIAIGPGGAIALTGSAGGNSALARYRPNGRIVRDFGDRGIVRLRRMTLFGAARDAIFEPDGRIVLAGGTEFKPVVRRFLPDGSPDREFAHSGTYSRGLRQLRPGLRDTAAARRPPRHRGPRRLATRSPRKPKTTSSMRGSCCSACGPRWSIPRPCAPG